MRPTSVIASMLAGVVKSDKRWRPWMPWRSVIATAVVALIAAPLSAQTPNAGDLIGRILGPGQRPIDGASVRLMRDTLVRETRSAEDGSYRLFGVGEGSWTFAVRAIGYRPLFGRLAVDGKGLTRDLVLERAVTQLDTVLVRDTWSGLRIVVGDGRYLMPIAGARIEVLSSRGVTLVTDSAGRAQLERPANARVTFTVRRDGFSPRVIGARTPDEGTTEVVVVLDSVGPMPINETIWRDLLQRQRWAGSGAASVGHEEIARTGATNLLDVVAASPSAISRGIGLYRNACVFIDGVPHTGTPPDAVSALDVEFIELFPPGTDWSRTLAARWPQGGQCGAPVTRTEITRPNAAQYVIIWTRSGRRGVTAPR